ncbi:uncharacterized protein LOC144614580 [Panthera onca]
MEALSARGHLTPGTVVIRRGEAGGARQQGWALAGSRLRERGPGARAGARAPVPGPSAAAASSFAFRLRPRSCSALSALPRASNRRPAERLHQFAFPPTVQDGSRFSTSSPASVVS